MSVHIESNKDDIAETVLMPGDPKRCEYIARKFLANAKLINNVRGMTGYTGYYKSKKITVFPSGMGNPSMGIYSYELFKEYDVNNIIRIGTMGAYTNLNLKDIVLVTNSVTNSNYGKFLCNYPNININGSIELNSAIEKLNSDERALITLFYYEEKTLNEIALILGLTESNAKVNLHRVSKKIYVLIKQEEV